MQKHYEADYKQLVSQKLSSVNRHDAMAQSVGGNFQHFGVFQRDLLLQHGLAENAVLLDIGCGSGRLANALRHFQALRYIGLDVVPELLAYAQEICGRNDWQFMKQEGFKLPFADNSIDMVTAFSVFTHLLHEESFAYLAEVSRVLKPGGKMIFSFLDFAIPEHWAVFVANVLQIHDHLNQFIDPGAIVVWCQRLNLQIEGVFAGNQPHIALREPAADENGIVYQGLVALGQSVCVIQKPLHAQQAIHVMLPDDFDADSYLALNPDVAAAGIDPRVHFITHGQFEHRRLR